MHSNIILQIEDIVTEKALAKMRLQFWRQTINKIYQVQNLPPIYQICYSDLKVNLGTSMNTNFKMNTTSPKCTNNSVPI